VKQLKKSIALLAALAPMLAAGMAAAQTTRWEFTPMVGYRIESDLTDADLYAYQKVELKDNISFGFALGYHFDRQVDGEVNYSYTSSSVTAVPRTNAVPERTFDLGIHDVQFAALWHTQPLGAPIRPYFALGMGFTVLSPSNGLDSHTKFCFSLGGGVKFNQSDRIGYRLEARWIPVYMYTTEGGYWCDPFYGCYYSGNDHFLNQIDFKAGVTVKF
jgi:opacity protein-like surface antigen